MFERGRSGNPKGRPPGTGMQGQLKRVVGERFDALVQVVLEAALAGDMTAANLLLSRLVPSLKPVAEPQAFPLVGATLTAQATGLLDATANGQLAPSDTKLLLDGLSAVARLRETEELERRIAALEGKTR